MFLSLFLLHLIFLLPLGLGLISPLPLPLSPLLPPVLLCINGHSGFKPKTSCNPIAAQAFTSFQKHMILHAISLATCDV